MPKTKPATTSRSSTRRKPAATFEVFEMFTTRREFYWYVKDAAGVVIDSWNATKPTAQGSFASEADARAWFADTYPSASDFHSTRREG